MLNLVYSRCVYSFGHKRAAEAAMQLECLVFTHQTFTAESACIHSAVCVCAQLSIILCQALRDLSVSARMLQHALGQLVNLLFEGKRTLFMLTEYLTHCWWDMDVEIKVSYYHLSTLIPTFQIFFLFFG